MMLLFSVQQVSSVLCSLPYPSDILAITHIICAHAECADDRFTCTNGLISGQQPPCISADQRCDGITDCIGGEDELDHNCPCRPEGAVRLVDGIVPYRGRVEFCINSRWSAVCANYYHWRDSNAAVVCRQLGYSNEG